MGKVNRSFNLLLATILLVFMTGTAVQAAPTAAEITGEIERLTLNDPTDVYSGGVMIVGGSQVILPKNLLIDLPANRLSLQQIFDQAPAICKTNGESGLAKADKCNASGTGGFATLSGVHSTAGNIIAGDVLIEKGKEVASGVVSYINYTDGYFRVNGIPGDSATGVMVRLNDPTSRHTIQQGLGCTTSGPGYPNCSPDPRFTLDPDNYVITFSTGYPVCIPSTVSRTFTSVPGVATSPAQSSATGTGDALCPDTNRTPAALVEPAVNDSRLFAPLVVGDSVNAEGNYEAVNGARFLSAHTMRVNKALATKNLPTQPDYMFLEEVFVEAPGFQNQRARALIIGFTTLAPTDVDIWSIHRDPVTNAPHEFPLASVKGCDAANNPGMCSSQGLVNAGANIFRIRYDVDFLMAAAGNPGGTKDAKLSPCRHLQANPRFASLNLCPGGLAAEFANNFGIMSPIPHEIQARTGHSLDNPGLNTKTLDINGNQATNGQYLFPFGMNLGGIETADFLEIDINLLNTPRLYEGIPWNLDRRLSPSGCLKATGCESTPQPLDPFPYTGLDPRIQANFLVGGLPGGTPTNLYNVSVFNASLLSVANNRVFSYVDGVLGKFNGNSTLLPCATGLCPPDPALITINPTPALNIFPPIADEDTAVANPGGPSVIINVLANDIPVFGVIDPFTVKIATPPTSGTAIANPDGTITYTPPPIFSFSVPTVSFTYTVANNYGAVSQPGTVTVTISVPPQAGDDAATTQTGSSVTINVIANDTSLSSTINPASVNVVSPPAVGCGTLAPNPLNGTLVFNAPATVPAAPGTCSFSYTVRDVSTPPAISNVATVTVTVTAPHNPPVAGNDTVSIPVNGTTAINVISNDSAGAGAAINPATIMVTTPTGGTATANPNGTVSYIAPAAPGSYSFVYTVQDTFASPATSNPATVTVTVTGANIAPLANNETVGASANGTITIPVLANDTSATSTINPATVIVSVPSGGTAVANPNGTVSYTAPAATGTYTFTYTVQDNFVPPATSNSATVTVIVAAAPVAPVAGNDAAITAINGTITIPVLANDSSATSTINPGTISVSAPTGGTATANPNGTITYTSPVTPGSYTFTYTVQDNAAPPLTSNSATVTVTATAVNIPPVANNDTAATTTNATITIPVLANDSSATSTINPASVSVSAPSGGTATANPATGTVSYTAPAAVGTYTFTYTVQDFAAAPATSNVATVTVTVAAPYLPPAAVNDPALQMTGGSGTSININVLANDTGGSSAINPASVVIVTQPINGSAVFNAVSQQVTYSPAPGFSGTDSFTYNVKDITGVVSNNATVTVTVNPPSTESLAVTLAQFIVNGLEWRVEGTTTARAAGETVTVYNNATVGLNPVGTATVDPNGNWKLLVKPGPLPTTQFSVQSSLVIAPAIEPAKLEGITLVIR